MKLGVESFMVMQEANEDFPGTVKKLSEAGFKYIEWLNCDAFNEFGIGNGTSAKDAKRVFDDNDMVLVGGIVVHEKADTELEPIFFDMDKMDRFVEWYSEAGCTTFGVANDLFPDADFLKRRMDAYNKIGEKCRNAGINFMYHNHFHEWQLINGRPIFDQIIEMTDPEYVGFDLDVYWGLRGLMDPKKMIHRLGGRIKSLHAKDFPYYRLDNVNILKQLVIDRPVTFEGYDEYWSLNVPEDFIECGEGVIKFQDIVDAGNEEGVPYIFIEQDYTTHTAFESLSISKNNMSKLHGLSLV